MSHFAPNPDIDASGFLMYNEANSFVDEMRVLSAIGYSSWEDAAKAVHFKYCKKYGVPLTSPYCDMVKLVSKYRTN